MTRPCLVCAAPTTGREWCSRRHRTALRDLGRALRPGLSSAEALQAGVAHRRLTSDLEWPHELVPTR